ncbi:hypothetical protein B296_00014554 [Ensete ventricosum]|uniref:Uncharacterized protein n=1 Tax=Ensete ventricosum TaxID=4639 RepID=A0A427AFW6_ENSVE|nr:hypothetical protein B296_00014554 [Ensete ventricosum]
MSEAAKIKKDWSYCWESPQRAWSSPTTASPILSRAGGLIRVGYVVYPFSQPCFTPVFIPDLNGSPPVWRLLCAKGGSWSLWLREFDWNDCVCVPVL